MEEERRPRGGGGTASAGVILWFTGWLFTIGFAHLAWWKIILGIVVWPWYLGNHMVGIWT